MANIINFPNRENIIELLKQTKTIGVSDHPDLTGRELPDQHPINAIDGLSVKLNNIEDEIQIFHNRFDGFDFELLKKFELDESGNLLFNDIILIPNAVPPHIPDWSEGATMIGRIQQRADIISASRINNHIAIAPGALIFDHNNGVLVPIVNPFDIPPSGTINAVRYTGAYLLVGTNTTPFLHIYKWNNGGNQYNRLSNPAAIPLGQIERFAATPDAKYFMASRPAAAGIVIYEHEEGTDNFVQILSNFVVDGAGAIHGAAFTPSGEHLFIGIGHGSHGARLMKKTSTSFERVTNPPDPGGAGRHVAISPDGTYVCLSLETNTAFRLYKRDGDNFDLLPTPTGGVFANRSWNSIFTNDNKYLFVIHQDVPYISWYERENDEFTRMPALADPPTAGQGGLAISRDGRYIFIGDQRVTNAQLTIYGATADI